MIGGGVDKILEVKGSGFYFDLSLLNTLMVFSQLCEFLKQFSIEGLILIGGTGTSLMKPGRLSRLLVKG